MAEGVPSLSQLSELKALRDHHQRPAMGPHRIGYRIGDLLQGEPTLGEEYQERKFPVGIGEPGGGGDEPHSPPHGLDHEHRIRRGRAPVLLLEALDRPCPIPGHGAVPRGVVHELHLRVAEVVVDGLGDTDHGELVSGLLGGFGYFLTDKLGVVSADPEEIPYIVGPEDLDDPLEVLFVFELVAGGADGPGGGGGTQ